MSLAHRPDEPSPFVRAFLAGSGSGDLDLAVDDRDEMLDFLVDWQAGDRERALFAYFRTGRSVADGLLQVLRWRGATGGRVLDFASGYGRITRFLVREIPPERLWVADVYADGVRFQAERFGVHAVVSTVRPEDLELGEGFDAILVTSLFTHLPEVRFLDWLRALCARLAPGGMLVFSTHDTSLLGSPSPPGDLIFQEISESGSLDTSDYGSTWVSEAFVRGAVERAARSVGRQASVHRLERGLCNYQDLYVAVLEPGVSFAGLEYSGEPHLFLERCAVAARDRLEMSGWAAVRTGEVEGVEVLLDGEPLAELPVDQPRPEVAAMLGEQRYLRSGWGGGLTLPRGLSRSTSVLVLSVRDGRGVRHPLWSGSVQALLVDSARNEIQDLDARLNRELAGAEAEIRQLRARLSAMEASRFWKLRNAWFGLKRSLGLARQE